MCVEPLYNEVEPFSWKNLNGIRTDVVLGHDFVQKNYKEKGLRKKES